MGEPEERRERGKKEGKDISDKKVRHGEMDLIGEEEVQKEWWSLKEVLYTQGGSLKEKCQRETTENGNVKSLKNLLVRCAANIYLVMWCDCGSKTEPSKKGQCLYSSHGTSKNIAVIYFYFKCNLFFVYA